MTVNTKYKASVFSFLFSDPELLRELYCALEDVSLPSDVPVTINTLQNVLYMGQNNDISFDIGGKLVILLEHQSTLNPNMSLRLMMYIARIYEKMFKDKGLYSSKLLNIPRPEFFVLYNGTESCPDDQVLRLSDVYTKAEIPGLPEKSVPSLELEVRVININEGRNEEITSRCRKLAEYSAFIAKARFFEMEMRDKEAAMKAAIKYCLEHDILKEFLEIHSKEVFNMLITEWDTEKAKEVWFEEGREEGIALGEERSQEKARQEKLRVVSNLKNLGVSAEIIIQATGLSAEEINRN